MRFAAAGYQGWSPVVEDEFRKLVADGVTWMREVLEWRHIETSPGVYDWSAWDVIFAACAATGMHYLPCISTTPAWARPSPGDPYNTPPADATDYANFCVALLDRYGPGGSFWGGASPDCALRIVDVWNEPWLWFGW